MSVKFITPPDSSTGKSGIRWLAEASELGARPGEWGLLKEGLGENSAGSMASNIKLGILRAFRPAGSFEAMQRKGGVYARFVGGNGQARPKQ